jgi:Na+:H+ antiporter, NhaC family
MNPPLKHPQTLRVFAKTKRSLTIVAHFTTLLLILTVLSHYLTHTLTCRTYKHAFEKQGLHAKNVTRISETWGTLPSSLIPWGPCGVFVVALYGVHPFAYAPYAFYILAGMGISLLYSVFDIDMAAVEPAKNEGLKKTSIPAGAGGEINE